MKKLLWMLTACLFAGMAASCAAEPSSEPLPEPSPPQWESHTLCADGFDLTLAQDESGWHLTLSHKGTPLCTAPRPAALLTVTDLEASPQRTEAVYEAVTANETGLTAQATLQTGGAEVQVIDRYSVSNDTFLLSRSVEVLSAQGPAQGFASIYALTDAAPGTTEDYEYFLPSVLYRNPSTLSSTAMLRTLTTVNWVKETRCATPLVMLRSKASGYSLALCHVSPQISATENLYQVPVAISNSQQYGALGFTLSDGVSLDFVYPSTETPVCYETGGEVRRYHELTVGTRQSYTLALLPRQEASYQDAMVRTYLAALALEESSIAPVDLQQVYDATIDLYHTLYVRYEGADGVYASGMPWAVNVNDPANYYAVSFQMGFVGAQTTIASQLIRDGVVRGNSRSLQIGAEILDFWASERVYKNTLPPVWWHPAEDDTAGKASNYPSFLRCFVDGAEGMLNACIYAKSSDLDYSRWEAAATKIADFLVENQNEDGSWYRAYYVTGKVCKDRSSPAYQGESTLNTPVAVRFLCRMYNYTGHQKYYEAAVRAADYCCNALYQDLGVYVGGTPDNPNVPDKEAAIFALYAFSAVYDMTGDETYLPALEHAAVSAMSWVYTYDFPVQFGKTALYEALNIFQRGGSAGWSIIATGHSSVDLFGAHAYNELYKQFLRSGDSAYLKVAALLQNNTKQAMDLTGERGYYHPGLAMEASNLADMTFFTVENGVWLPWVSAAFLEPMIQTERQFGSWDILRLQEEQTRS